MHSFIFSSLHIPEHFLILSKRNKMKKFLSWYILGALLFSMQLNASNAFAVYQGVEQDSTKIPKVFLLGEYEAAFDELTRAHQTQLLSACNDDMNLAFGKWVSMVQEMEAFAKIMGYNLDGTRLWVNVFWNENGSIDHIAYFLKPNSRNIDTRELTAFFNKFIENYTFPLNYKQKFSHYGTASFPTMPKRVKKNEAIPKMKETKDSVKAGK